MIYCCNVSTTRSESGTRPRNGSSLTWRADHTASYTAEEPPLYYHIVACSVPQGSVLGLLLFILYTAELADLAAEYGVKLHAFADDNQLHVHCDLSNVSSSVTALEQCISAISHWMSANRVKLNADKTELMWAGTKHTVACLVHDQELTLTIGTDTAAVDDAVRVLSVLFTPDLALEKNATSVSAKCFFQLRQLRRVRRFLDRDSATTWVHAFVTSRIDYGNSLFAAAPKIWTDKLQRVMTHENSTGVWSDFCMRIYTGWTSHNALRTSCACWCSWSTRLGTAVSLCTGRRRHAAPQASLCHSRTTAFSSVQHEKTMANGHSRKPAVMPGTARTSATNYFDRPFQTLTHDVFIRAYITFSALETSIFCLMGYISLLTYLLYRFGFFHFTKL